MSAALMPDSLPSPDAVSAQPAQARDLGEPLGASFERYSELQRGSARLLMGLLLMLLALLLVQLWRASQANERQLRLHGALVELNQLSSRAEQAEAALITYRGTANGALLRSVQPCAGHCLAAAELAQAASPDLSTLDHLLSRVVHWSGKVDQALLELSGGPMSAARGHEIADDAITLAGRELRTNLLAVQSGVLDLLADSEAGRHREALILQWLLGSLALVAFGGLLLAARRSQRLASAGLLAEQSLRELSLRDPLTGLPNRRALGMRLEHMIERAERHGGGPAVLTLDLDGFKRMNDFYGHAAGDAALVELAKRLSGVLRKSDLPARVAGDEFVVLLDDPDSPETARAVGERLLLALRAPVDLPAPIGPVALGASVGLAHYPACGRTAQALLGAADAACQAAKLAGKNRLFESRPPTVPAASRAA
jgi:diguanylate cyclase (GGDEF)-like protein